MCGIFAIFGKEDEPYVSNAANIIKGRGPDSTVISKDINNGWSKLVFTRLAIVDTSVNGDQPFIDGNISLMCNGEIYNHRSLEEEYDLKCKSNSDCECILHLYKKIGFQETVDRLDGVFSICLVDGDRVHLARDRIGVRPLFIGKNRNGTFAVSSLARTLLDFCDDIYPLKPCKAIYDFSRSGGGGYTELFEEHILPPKITLPCNVTEHNIKFLQEKIRDTLVRSVQKRLMTDRKICCMLSGGLDSSLITSILCRLVGSQNVHTYSVGMEDSVDLKYAKVVSDYLGTQHHEVKFTPQEGLDAIPYVIRDLESYDITTVRASVGMWLLSKYISENSDNIVILSGEGADELLFGYLYFHYAPSSLEAQEESIRLVKNLHKYDVLRADRCVSSHGLELRVPFLDREFVDLVLNIPGEFKNPKTGGPLMIEKEILRNAFSGYLPEEVLWRRKDGMSDALSGLKKNWFEYIQDFVDTKINDSEWENINSSAELNNTTHLHQSLVSKEAYYYKTIYDDIFGKYQPEYPYWMPKWVVCDGNPSGRVLEVYDEEKQ